MSHKFEDKIKSKLYDTEMDVNADLWSKIELQLPKPRISMRTRIVRFASASVAAAALVGIALLSFNSTDTVLTDSIPIAVNHTVAEPYTPITSEIIVEKQFESKARAIHAPQAANNKMIAQQIIKSESETSEVEEPHFSSDKTQENKVQETPKKSLKYSIETLYSLDQDYDELFKKTIKNSKSNKWQIGLLASSSMLSVSKQSPNQPLLRHSSASSDYMTTYEASRYRFIHHMPISLGLLVSKEVLPRLSIETGAAYTLLTASMTSLDESTTGKQSLHYVGLPVSVNYRIAQWGKVELYTALGGRIDFNVGGQQKADTNRGQLEGHTYLELEEDPQFSINARVGIAFACTKWLQLYAEPQAGYYFDNKSGINNFWKDRPLSFSAQIGLRTKF